MSAAEPLWIEVLRKAVAASDQGKVGARIGYSGSAVSAVLAGKYTAGLDRFQRAVEGGLMNATVQCPVVGEMAQQKCIEHQRAPYAATTPQRVALYRACRNGCAHSLIKSGADAEESP